MFRKMPFILLAMTIIAVIANSWLPIEYKSALYAASLSLKEVIIFMLPLLIFSLLFKTSLQLARTASKMILTIFAAVCVSNCLSTLISYSAGLVAYGLDLSMNSPLESNALKPTWHFSLPKLIGNDIAMFSGLALGILVGRFRPNLSTTILPFLDKLIAILLKTFLCLIPLFIAGFVVKMAHDQVMTLILENYSVVFLLVACAVFSYIALIYLIANQFQGAAFIRSVKNMIPAAIAGFGSMSSAAAMPLTIYGTEKNSKNPDLAGSLIPATVNIHLIGDCFAIPIFAFAVLKNFGVAEPSFFAYLIFVGHVVFAKFSVAAVPGGGILVMLPILESVLGFNVEMLSLITALYILFDPIITCANVLGNGGFAMIMSRWLPEKESVKPKNGN